MRRATGSLIAGILAMSFASSGAAARTGPPSHAPVSQLVVFGDSLSDIGNAGAGGNAGTDRFLFWDGVHPTAAAHARLAEAALGALSGVSPGNAGPAVRRPDVPR